MINNKNFYKLVKSGLRNPHGAAAWIQGSVASAWPRYRYPDQRKLINSFRENDSYLLIVLDACRFGEFSSIYESYFTGDLKKAWAAGHNTFQYVRRCWSDEYSEVVYNSGATPINSHDTLSEDSGLWSRYQGYRPRNHIGTIVDVWNSDWAPELGTCPPGPVADHTIMAIEDGSQNVVAHFFQPHAPYVGKPESGEFRLLGHANNKNASPRNNEPVDKPIWTAVRHGDITDDELRKAYCANLEAALTHACRVVKAGIEADLPVVVTADHGEALGEYGMYAHTKAPNPYVRVIPWLEVQKLQPKGEKLAIEAPRVVTNSCSEQEDTDTSTNLIRDRLQDLGYLDKE